MLNREEILAVAAESEPVAEYEMKMERKSELLGAAISFILLSLMMMYELVALKILDFGKPAVYLSFWGVANLYSGVKMHSLKRILYGIIEMVFVVLFLIIYLGAKLE